MLETVLLDTQIHDRRSFNCGVPALNDYLQKQANSSAKRSLTKTYVLVDSERPTEIIGFYTLSFAEVVAPKNSKLANYPHPIPALKLSRMAVSLKFKGHRFGEQLLLEIITKTARTARADSPAPVIGIFVDPKNGAEEFEVRPVFGPNTPHFFCNLMI